jgi:hypothetical protein
MKEQIHENFVPPSQLPDEPHFEDELTILKARPVVPLKQFDEKVQRKRRRLLVGAFVLTMFLGTVSGLISGHFKLRAISDAPVIQLGIQTLNVPEESPSSTVVQEPKSRVGFAAVLPSRALVEEPQLKVVTRKRPIMMPTRDTINTNHSVPLPSLNGEEELRRIREALLTQDSKKLRVRQEKRRERRGPEEASEHNHV